MQYNNLISRLYWKNYDVNLIKHWISDNILAKMVKEKAKIVLFTVELNLLKYYSLKCINEIRGKN